MVPASVGLRGSGAGLREVLAPWRCGSICRLSTACSRAHLGARHRRPRPVFPGDRTQTRPPTSTTATVPFPRPLSDPSGLRHHTCSQPPPVFPRPAPARCRPFHAFGAGRRPTMRVFLGYRALHEAGDSPGAAAATPRARHSSDRPRGDLHRDRLGEPSWAFQRHRPRLPVEPASRRC